MYDGGNPRTYYFQEQYFYRYGKMKTKNAIAALHSLAQESRLSIFCLLMEKGEEGLCAGTISEILDIPPTTMSFHLSQLKNAGLVESHKDGRMVIYVANRKRAKKLAGYITGKKLPPDAHYGTELSG